MSDERIDEIMLAEDIAGLGVVFKPSSDSRALRAWAWIVARFGVKGFLREYWVTVDPTIYYPEGIQNPLLHFVSVRHELVHVWQQRRAGRILWFSLYFASSWFRWSQERAAYLVNVRNGWSPEQIADTLHKVYKCWWPSRKAMTKWLRDNA